MSVQAVEEFRGRINVDPLLMEKVSKALQSGMPAVVALGAEHGYSFTEAEADHALTEHMKDGELSDFELELVSAGNNSACGGSDNTPRT